MLQWIQVRTWTIEWTWYDFQNNGPPTFSSCESSMYGHHQISSNKTYHCFFASTSASLWLGRFMGDEISRIIQAPTDGLEDVFWTSRKGVALWKCWVLVLGLVKGFTRVQTPAGTAWLGTEVWRAHCCQRAAERSLQQGADSCPLNACYITSYDIMVKLCLACVLKPPNLANDSLINGLMASGKHEKIESTMSWLTVVSSDQDHSSWVAWITLGAMFSAARRQDSWRRGSASMCLGDSWDEDNSQS